VASEEGMNTAAGAISRWFRSAVEEPYRIFFPLGIFWGAVGVGHWLFFALHWIPAYSMQLHSAIQVDAYMGCFIVGFLLTAIPRFASAPFANGKEVLVFFVLLNAAPVFYLRQEWIYARFCFAAWLLTLVVFGGRRFLKKTGAGLHPPVEFVWLPAAFLCGLSGVSLMIGADASFFPPVAGKIGKLLSEQGFLLCIVLGVGSFLGPRLMGTFKPAVKGAVYLQIGAILGLVSTFVLEGAGDALAAYLIRACIIALVYFRSGALVFRPLVKDQFARLLCISFWMVFLGYAGLVFFPAYRPAFLHVTFLGGYALMTFSVATMVVFSHGGEGDRLKRASWQLPMLGGILALALSLRAAAVFFPEYFFILLGAASVGWLLGAGLWLFYVTGAIFRLFPKEELERRHEEAKARVAALKASTITV